MARRSTRLLDKVAQSPPTINISPEHKLLITKELRVDLSGSKIVEFPTSPRKVLSIKNEINATSDELNDQNDTPIKFKKKNPFQENSKHLSEYEKKVLQNIEERKKMLQVIIGDAKSDFLKSVTPTSSEKVGKECTQRGLKRKFEERVISPMRMSLRSTKPAKEEFVSLKDPEEEKPIVKKLGPFTLADAYYDQESVEDINYIKDMIPLLEKEGELEKLPADQQDFLKLMKSFSIREEGVAKVTTGRIYSLAWHPSNCKLLVAAGDRDGKVGFWDIDKLEDKHQGVRAFKIHGMPINCTTFDKFNLTRLLTTSYDGHVRCLDLNTNVIDDVYSIKRTKDTWTAYHAQKDASTLVVSHSNGNVAVVDVRTKPGEAQNIIQCFEMSARTISLHPQDDNLFLVCNRYGEAGIFDMRYTNAHATNEDDLAIPVIGLPKAPKGIHGAFFSPITGKYVLTTCTDDTLKVYDVQKSNVEPECIKSIYHNNFTGRWLTPFKAVWHPQRDDVFIVGSMEKPRRVELYGAPSGTLLHNFDGDCLASITSINAFHPSVPIFAGGNSSGRVHIFRS